MFSFFANVNCFPQIPQFINKQKDTYKKLDLLFHIVTSCITCRCYFSVYFFYIVQQGSSIVPVWTAAYPAQRFCHYLVPPIFQQAPCAALRKHFYPYLLFLPLKIFQYLIIPYHMASVIFSKSSFSKKFMPEQRTMLQSLRYYERTSTFSGTAPFKARTAFSLSFWSNNTRSLFNNDTAC